APPLVPRNGSTHSSRSAAEASSCGLSPRPAVGQRRERSSNEGVVKLGMTLPSCVVGVDGPTIREWCRRIDDGPYSCVAVGERVAYPSHDLIPSLRFAGGG